MSINQHSMYSQGAETNLDSNCSINGVSQKRSVSFSEAAFNLMHLVSIKLCLCLFQDFHPLSSVRTATDNKCKQMQMNHLTNSKQLWSQSAARSYATECVKNLELFGVKTQHITSKLVDWLTDGCCLPRQKQNQHFLEFNINFISIRRHG